jgi:hypothetical protein
MVTTMAKRGRVPVDVMPDSLFPLNDREITEMGLLRALQWAASDDGRLRADRLARIAEVRRYKRGWVTYNAGRHWEDVWRDMTRWRRQEENSIRFKSY